MAKALARLERVLEGIMKDSITRRAGGRLHPVEIAKKLAQEMEANQTISARRVLVPNLYTVHLNPADLEPLEPFREALEVELAAYLAEAAREKGLATVAYPRVKLVAEEVPRRRVVVQGRIVEGEEVAEAQMGRTARLELPSAARVLQPRGWLLMAGPDGRELACPIDRFPFTLGRALDNDLVLEAREVSRHHAQLREIKGRPYLVDLTSKNGTFLNGERITAERLLQDGDVITLGRVRLVLRWEQG
jgi:hypothetical protein